ncbi:hypothetical protein [Actinokineospora sp. HUAS TT18]|uniref:hypothetical protein n=1 Tax=Actinokineospora sp. HUAS TT18 TaxID=3447451 RepID=UPI003F521BE1
MRSDKPVPDPGDHVWNLVIAAEMEALEAPYAIVGVRSDTKILFLQGPYPDGVSAMRDLEAIQDSPLADDDTRYSVVPLWPAS